MLLYFSIFALFIANFAGCMAMYYSYKTVGMLFGMHKSVEERVNILEEKLNKKDKK